MTEVPNEKRAQPLGIEDFLPLPTVNELGARLLAELRPLVDLEANGQCQELVLARTEALLKHVQNLAWPAVAKGEFAVLPRILDELRRLQRFVDLNAPELPPSQALAVAIKSTISSLAVAESSLKMLRSEAKLKDCEKSRSERDILRVLAEGEHAYLRRGQIHERLALPRPTPARVGQILEQLMSEAILKRVHATAQGNGETAHYSLSPFGRDLVSILGIKEVESWQTSQTRWSEVAEKAVGYDREYTQWRAVLQIAIHNALDLELQPEVRKVAAGMLESASERLPNALEPELVAWISALISDDGRREIAIDIYSRLKKLKSRAGGGKRSRSGQILLKSFESALNFRKSQIDQEKTKLRQEKLAFPSTLLEKKALSSECKK